MADRKRGGLSGLVMAGLAVMGLSASASPAQPVSHNMQMMGAIARAIADGGELAGVDWVEVSAIFAFDADGDVNQSYGYAYDAHGEAHAATFLEDDIEHEVNAYREWLRKPGDKGLIKMLFQFNRRTLRVNADFEYEDPLRWQVTPDNLDTIIKELRPNLGADGGQQR